MKHVTALLPEGNWRWLRLLDAESGAAVQLSINGVDWVFAATTGSGFSDTSEAVS